MSILKKAAAFGAMMGKRAAEGAITQQQLDLWNKEDVMEAARNAHVKTKREFRDALDKNKTQEALRPYLNAWSRGAEIHYPLRSGEREPPDTEDLEDDLPWTYEQRKAPDFLDNVVFGSHKLSKPFKKDSDRSAEINAYINTHFSHLPKTASFLEKRHAAGQSGAR